MKYIFVLISVWLCLPTSQLIAQPCSQLPKSFSSYELAVKKIRDASFRFDEKVNCNKSSWIKSAEYYSCDGNSGFFILTTKENKFFLHKNMPFFTWKEFKSASSFGSYYNQNIKGRYKFSIN